MKTTKEKNNKRAFSIVELLTVMSIIVLLIGILLPAINYVRKYARDVKQKAQFHAIDVAIEMFHNDYGGYPPSDSRDDSNNPYCGAAKLCEALMGFDLRGFNPSSSFYAKGGATGGAYDTTVTGNLQKRKTVSLTLENASAYRLWHIWGKSTTATIGLQDENFYVLCSPYGNFKNRDPNGKGNVGMPILYYKANTANTIHDSNKPYNANVYNFTDNVDLVMAGVPPAGKQPLLSPTYFYVGPPTLKPKSGAKLFYEKIQNVKLSNPWPHRSDSYILLSAGADAEYGTNDDIYNFEK